MMTEYAAAPDVDGTARPATIALLGASNLTRAMSIVVETLRLQHGSPLRVIAALGHGRSFGTTSSVLGRTLCSILDCAVWRAIECHPPRFALITDIGNDVMYGASPREIAAWVSECVDRLERAGVERINLTALPIDSIRAVQRWQFAVVRAILFPSRDITYEAAIARVFETQSLIEELATRRAPIVRLVHHDRRWYGVDPIHIRSRFMAEAWARFLSERSDDRPHRPTRSFRRWWTLVRHRPASWTLWGIQRNTIQPISLNNDIHVEMY